MKNLGSKFLTIWGLGTGIVAVIIGLIVLGFTQGLSFVHAVMSGISDVNSLGITLGFLTVALLISFSMFVIGRWCVISDAIGELSTIFRSFPNEVRILREDVQTLKGIVNSQCDAILNLSRTLANRTPDIIEDVTSEWAGFVFRLITYNPSFLREVFITMLAGGQQLKISIDADRVYGNFLARLQQRMQLIYVLYLPRELAFGENPAEVLLRLVHIIRCCRAKVGTESLVATVTIFLIDRPRSPASLFFGFRSVLGRLEHRVLEYFRSLRPGQISTPTGEKYIVQHSMQKRIDELYEHVEHEVQQRGSVEIEFNVVESIVGPFLPVGSEGVVPMITADQWRMMVNALYDVGWASRPEAELVVHPDHVAFHEHRPSIYTQRYRPLGELPVIVPQIEEPTAAPAPVEALAKDKKIPLLSKFIDAFKR